MLRKFADLVLLRYAAASALALVVDLGLFLALLALDTPAAAAAAAGYSLGIVTHWLASSRAVFTAGVAANGPARTRQKALFVVSALLGLGLTSAIVALGGQAGIDPRLAKLAAIAASFALTWLMRERIVFRLGAVS